MNSPIQRWRLRACAAARLAAGMLLATLASGCDPSDGTLLGAGERSTTIAQDGEAAARRADLRALHRQVALAWSRYGTDQARDVSVPRAEALLAAGEAQQAFPILAAAAAFMYVSILYRMAG